MRFSPIRPDTTTNAKSATVPYARVLTVALSVPDDASASTSVTIKNATHTKRQCPIWIAQLTARVERAEFSRLHTLAKAAGGHWSSFGPVEIHGFIFFEEVKAQAFALLVNPTRPGESGRVDKCDGETVSIPPTHFPTCPPAVTTPPQMPAWRARLLRRA